MPAESERQRRFMGAELARKRAGEATRTNMSEANLVDFASKSFVMKDALDFIDEFLKARTPEQKLQSAGQSAGGRYPKILAQAEGKARGEADGMQVPPSNVSGEGGSAHEKLAGGVARGLVARRQEADPDPRGVVPRAVLEQEGIRQPVSPANVLNEQEILYRRRRKGEPSPRRLWTRERQSYRRPTPRVSEENLERQAVASFEDVDTYEFPATELNTAQQREIQETAEANIALSTGSMGSRTMTNENNGRGDRFVEKSIEYMDAYIEQLEKQYGGGPTIVEEGLVGQAQQIGRGASAVAGAAKKGVSAIKRGVGRARTGAQERVRRGKIGVARGRAGLGQNVKRKQEQQAASDYMSEAAKRAGMS